MTDNTTTRPPTDDDARNTLETAICDIGSIASTLMALGERQDGHLAYLGGQLVENYRLVDDGFNRIYGIGKYASAKQGAERGSAAVSPPASEPVDNSGTEAPDTNHDAQAAAIYRAMALRFYCRYTDMRGSAEFRGGDLQEHGPLCSARDAGEQYERAVEDFLWEGRAETSGQALALVEFAGVIATDKLQSEVIRDSAPVSDERDAFHQTIALAAAAEWINTSCLKEWFKDQEAAHGPSASRGGTAEGDAA